MSRRKGPRGRREDSRTFSTTHDRCDGTDGPRPGGVLGSVPERVRTPRGPGRGRRNPRPSIQVQNHGTGYRRWSPVVRVPPNVPPTTPASSPSLPSRLPISTVVGPASVTDHRTSSWDRSGRPTDSTPEIGDPRIPHSRRNLLDVPRVNDCDHGRPPGVRFESRVLAVLVPPQASVRFVRNLGHTGTR